MLINTTCVAYWKRRRVLLPVFPVSIFGESEEFASTFSLTSQRGDELDIDMEREI
jgi:hypothetical protein